MYFLRFVLFCTDSVNDFLRRNCPYIAGAIAFYALFSLFPLFLAIISIAGFFLGDEAAQIELAGRIAGVIPVEAEFIGGTLEGVVSARAITGVASIFGLLWAASSAFGAIRKGINAAWGVTRTRPFLRERFIDFALVFGAGILMMAVLFVTPTFAFLKQITDAVAPDAGVASAVFWGLAAQLLTPLLSYVAFLLLYRFIPNTKVTLSDVWLVALGAAIAFEGAKWGFVWYVQTFPVYNVVYGAVGAVMAFLTWVYVSAIILLFGALVSSRFAAYAREVQEEKGLGLVWAGLSRVRLRVVPAHGKG